MLKHLHANLRQPCPCGSGKQYEACCALWHAGDLVLMAPDAEKLMRSRYTAFVFDLRDYLMQTWHPKTRPPEIAPAEEGLKWLGLQVQRFQQTDETEAVVEFVARYRIHGRGFRMHEVSRFEKLEGRWFYLNGDVTN